VARASDPSWKVAKTMEAQQPRPASGFTKRQVLGIVLATVLVTVGATGWVLRTYVFPSRFEPVQLSAREEQVLDAKLRRIGIEPASAESAPDPSPVVGSAPREPATGHTEREAPRLEPRPRFEPEPRLEPEPYSEDPADREIGISERELNALLAHNTNLAERLAIDLSDDLASAKLLIPVDPDFPVMGGRILRVHAGVELRVVRGRPVVILRGISLMGVPLPNAWLGNLKQVDLVERFGGQGGFWSAFAAGVEEMSVREGELKLVLKE
jgi:hypothetical protein